MFLIGKLLKVEIRDAKTDQKELFVWKVVEDDSTIQFDISRRFGAPYFVLMTSRLPTSAFILTSRTWMESHPVLYLHHGFFFLFLSFIHTHTHTHLQLSNVS